MHAPPSPNLRPIRGGALAWVPPAELVEALEREVLEAIMFEPGVRERVAELVTPLDFSSPRLRAVYAAMQRVDAITVPLLAEELGRGGELETAGGIVALSELEDAGSTAAHAEVHARAVRRHALERRARELHERAAQGEGKAVRAELESIEQALAELEIRRDFDDVLLTGGRLRALRDENAAASPLAELFDTEPSLHLIQGRPKSGKTRLALHLAVAWAEGLAPWPGADALPGTRSLIVSAEQSARRIERTLRGVSLGVRGSQLARWTDRVAIAARDRSLPAEVRRLLTLDRDGMGLLRAVLQRARDAGRPFGLAVLDSLSRLKPPDMEENSADDMTALCGGLQEIAEAQGIYLLAVHHRGHSGDASRAGAIGASRGSSAIAAVAQVAWTLDEVPGEPRQRVLRIAGNEVLERELEFEVAAPDAAPGRVDYWRPIDPQAEHAGRLDELIAPGETISTTELAWRLADRRPEDGNERPPGKMAALAAQLRRQWQRDGRIHVEDLGRGRGHRITRTSEGSK